ncbi:glycosyltransferase [Fulvivirga ligni]|uniref:glycosyltransferase n=1 Tax=Fulvivirga ligni TaxID=2904246 RepID=UPI001F20036B|nr:glycosyltransferase [Fulvivirga ligni]UII23872.1 glycosyltransferase [Fulvivirga ligni]
MKLAAFVITYNRPDIIGNTIKLINEQTLKPDLVLVVDNSESNDTEKNIRCLEYNNIEYLRTGYNAGPAGAAKLALRVLADKGYDWVYWGDDDDPPRSKKVFRRLIDLIEDAPNKVEVGAIGSVGGFFNQYTARVSNIRNDQINAKGLTEVDQIPGGHNFLINTRVTKAAIEPTEKLFFGFEELDFCLKIKKAGFKLYIDGETVLKNRILAGNTAENYKWKSTSFGDSSKLKRNYYSIRNMSFILYTNGYYLGCLYFFNKNLAKAMVGFLHGPKYGVANFKIFFKGTLDFLLGKYGKRDVER